MGSGWSAGMFAVGSIILVYILSLFQQTTTLFVALEALMLLATTMAIACRRTSIITLLVIWPLTAALVFSYHYTDTREFFTGSDFSSFLLDY